MAVQQQLQQQLKTENPCIGCFKNYNHGHRATRDFFFAPSIARVSIQHNFVTTLSQQPCHMVVTVSITKLFRACHKPATRLPQGYCGNLVATL